MSCANSCIFPIHSGYLRGVDVIDQISITYNGLSQSLEWLKHGFKMHFPENALPPGIDDCQVLIKASFSGQFNFPRDTELISGIYWISSQHIFTRPVTVEIQHCIQKDIYRPSSLTYIVTKCSQKSLPYQFKTLDGGVFSPSSQYGSIDLTRFSGLAISSHQTHVRSYCARLYYNSSGIHGWEVYFTIMWNLELHIAVSVFSNEVQGINSIFILLLLELVHVMKCIYLHYRLLMPSTLLPLVVLTRR